MANKTKGVQVSATVPVEIEAAIEDHRWTVRKSKTEVVYAAIVEYLERHGVKYTVAAESAEGTDAPAADAKPETDAKPEPAKAAKA